MVDREVLPLCLGREVDPEVDGGRKEVLPLRPEPPDERLLHW